MFLKLNRDNELISILSLGLGLKPFKILLYFGLIIIIIFTILNLYIAPIVYEKYKIKEHELNTIDFDSMTFSNFLNLNNTTILDFKKIIMNMRIFLLHIKMIRIILYTLRKETSTLKTISINFN